MEYQVLKHAHAGLAYLSAVLFLIRFAMIRWVPAKPAARWFRILPHGIDAALLVLAVMLSWQLGQYPLTDGWLTAKVLALVVLVGSGVRAIRQGSVAWALVTLGCYVYIIGVAKTHSVLSWATHI